MKEQVIMDSSNSAVHSDVQSVRRALTILGTFSAERPQLGVAEIAQIVGLNRTTVYRLVGTLESCGMLRRDAFSQKYTLSAQVLRFADVFLQQSDLRSVALPVMTALRDEVNETVALHLREGSSRIVITQIGAHRDIRHMYRNLGQPIPLHLGAPGKAILANVSALELNTHLADCLLVGATPHSITDPDVLREDLKAIGKRGYAVSWEERRLGVVAIAAPIFDATGTVVASINVSGPSQRIRNSHVRSLGPLVVESANEVSRSIGYIGEDGQSPS
jgi:IclR family acetate operon transcriptional repressor